MQFGLYAPIPMVTVGSAQSAQAVREALAPLPDNRRDAQYDLTLDILLEADQCGFDLALFAERHLGHDMAAWVMASAVAPRLQNIRALVAAHPGLWDPVMVAKLVASLDRICVKRVALNIVNGWFDEEFTMFGGTLLQGEPRYQRTQEFISIMRALWAEESLTFKGAHYSVENARLLLKPAGAALPEMFSVSRSDRGRQFIAEHCDWWFIDYPKEAETTDQVLAAIEVAIEDMNRRTRASGRKVRYALNPFCALGSDPADALKSTVEQILRYDNEPDNRKVEKRMLPATRAGCVGTPKAVLRQVKRFEEIGIELLLLKVIPTVENVRTIGREIVQASRDGSQVRTLSPA